MLVTNGKNSICVHCGAIYPGANNETCTKCNSALTLEDNFDEIFNGFHKTADASLDWALNAYAVCKDATSKAQIGRIAHLAAMSLVLLGVMEEMGEASDDDDGPGFGG